MPPHVHPGGLWPGQIQFDDLDICPPGALLLSETDTGAWKCNAKDHVWQDVLNSSGRSSCGVCGQGKGKTTCNVVASWDLPGKGFATRNWSTTFKLGVGNLRLDTKQLKGRHMAQKMTRMRHLVRRQFPPSFSDDDLRPYWPRYYKWTDDKAFFKTWIEFLVERETKKSSSTSDDDPPMTYSESQDDLMQGIEQGSDDFDVLVDDEEVMGKVEEDDDNYNFSDMGGYINDQEDDNISNFGYESGDINDPEDYNSSSLCAESGNINDQEEDDDACPKNEDFEQSQQPTRSFTNDSGQASKLALQATLWGLLQDRLREGVDDQLEYIVESCGGDERKQGRELARYANSLAAGAMTESIRYRTRD